MNDVKKAVGVALNASWSRFVSLVAVGMVLYGLKSVDSWESLARLLVATSAVVALLFIIKLGARRLMGIERARAGKEEPKAPVRE